MTSGTLKGPQKAPSNIRVTTRIDHNPERCKDYYEHGYCGFGDTCIFLHDRGDYKSGHQLDLEYEEALKKKQRRLINKQAAEDSDESNYEIASSGDEDGQNAVVCRICEAFFRDPVTVPCGHSFCEACALRNYAEDPNCFICGKDTTGIFNAAPEVEARVKKVYPAKGGTQHNLPQDAGAVDSDDPERTTVTKYKPLETTQFASDSSSNGLTKEEKAIMAEYQEQ